MKPIQSAIIAAAALLGYVSAQTATTVPVGYYNYDAKAGDNYFVSGLVNSPVFAGAITGSGATSLTLAANSLTANALNAAGGYPTHYVEIRTAGDNQGVIIDITSNTTSGITLASDISALALAGTEQIFVRKHVTVLSLFANTESTIAQSSDTVTFFNADETADTYFLIASGEWSSDFSTPNGNNRPIPPGTGFIFQTAADVSLTILGEVKSSPTVIQINGGGVINIVGPVNPLVGSSKQIVELGFANMETFSDSITTYAPGDNVTPLLTYFADGLGNVTTDFGTTNSTDVLDFTKGVVYQAATDTSFRVLSGL